jgi:subtilisin family serine protease
VAAARDFAPQDNKLDATGHGTAVAEVVLAVAPGTRVLALDVFRADGLAYDSDILRAIDWVIGRRTQWNVRSLNLSIADGTYWIVACPLSGLAPAFEAAGAADMVVSVASGNAASVAGHYVNGVAYPACVPGATSVGGVYDADVGRVTSSGCTDSTTAPDRIACFSQGGRLLGLLAPAALITAGGRVGWRGTSFATAHVAGAVAVLAAAERSATAERIGSVLRSTGPQLGDPRNGSRRHRLDLYRAASRIRDATPPSVMGRAPVAGAVGVAPSASVVVSFSEGVTGVGGGSMWLSDAQGTPVPARVTYDAARRRATLDPTLPLLPGGRYTVRLTSDIRDAAGNPLRSYIWSFTTAA